MITMFMIMIIMITLSRYKSLASWRQQWASLGRGWIAPAGWPIHSWPSAAERSDHDHDDYRDHNGHDQHDDDHDDLQVDKTELDDIRSGMEKERCKINYFQVIRMIRITTMIMISMMVMEKECCGIN